MVEMAAQRLREDETARRVAFFAVGVKDADMARLSDIVVRTPIRLEGLNFVEMFVWLSASMQRVVAVETRRSGRPAAPRLGRRLTRRLLPSGSR